MLANVDHEEVPLYKVDTEESEGDEELTVLQLKEDRLLAGFVPLLAAPQEPCYIDRHTDTVRGLSGDIPALQAHHLCVVCVCGGGGNAAAIHLFTCAAMFVFFPQAIAADCKRVTVLKYFLEALCGQEEPLLAFKGGKYISVATPPSNQSGDTRSRQDSLTEKEVLCLSSLSAPLALQDIFTADATIFFFINYVNAGCEEAGEGSETQIAKITSHLCVCVLSSRATMSSSRQSLLSLRQRKKRRRRRRETARTISGS